MPVATDLITCENTATPKQIRELMNIDGLTNDEVKSHLQKGIEGIHPVIFVYLLHNFVYKFSDSPMELMLITWSADRCITDRKYQQAIGSSIECRRFDKLKEAILSSDDIHATLAYCMSISHAFVNKREYRSEVLLLLAKVYQDLPSPDYLNICQCLKFLDQPEGVAKILKKLLRSENKDDAMMAFQIALILFRMNIKLLLIDIWKTMTRG
ncbi:26S proteasome regulatory complex, non-ATPase subcomplex, Rpn2/Psmd1 subunit [Artemisia annua]|uniref:26S proteasome regulatory complex, non-ATPase subcomplex, Rpn2/Psmd1 subunit n=1 Tax=Artemisia annua TaxID=35608 RepID=A0A2U1M557_ARTAN|nr:26S proteasome regulatory complex, non-ATPase subcomplex, Rpn2/Psmd1 subunit [Artemisia annua]